MKSGNKIWSTIVDYFLILGAIIGVGFASGKEIYEFFFKFEGASILGLLAFGLLYIYLFFVIQHINRKLNLKSYSEFNQAVFGRFCKISNIVMIINFTITCAGMLAGADYIFETFFNIGFKIPSIVLSVITFVVLLGGIKKVKIMSNFIIPIMIAIIVINSIGNTTPQNVNLEISVHNGIMAVYYSILFGVNNFVAALPVLFETKLKSKGKLVVILTICLIILLNILVFASNNFSTDMPMFELSSNVAPMFYYIYFTALIMALFSTLMICTFNIQKILFKANKSKFYLALIVIFNLILSNVGYGNIVKYFYVVSGIISGIYVVLLSILIVVKLLRIKRKKQINSLKNNKNI